MDRKNTRKLQRKVLRQTQQRLNRLLQLLMRSHSSQGANTDTNDALEEILSRSVAQSMFTNGFSVGPFGLTPPSTDAALTSVTPQESQESDMADICNDIRGRDRTCCNTASRCFDDVKTVVDELDNATPGSFSLMSACRKVGSELKRDKICVQRSLSRCGGPDRALLQRRFNNRVDTLYNQFYKHCSRNPPPTTLPPTDGPSTQENSTSIVDITNPNGGGISLPPGVSTSKPSNSTTHGGTHIPLSQIPGWSKPGAFSPVTPHDHSSHDHSHDLLHETSASSGSTAVLAGAITGGIVLVMVLVIGLVFWCKSRREKNGSNGSADSAGIFFQKRPNMFSTERPRGENNNKHPLTRQESTVYAEIDEAMVNPGYKPPVPGNAPHSSYLNPISDEDSYTPPPGGGSLGSAPIATTRGQLSYGPILAANGAPASSSKDLFYHSTSVTDPSIHNRDAFLTEKNLQTGTENGSSDSAYITAESMDASNESLDDYEEPISANNSIRYAPLDQISPPKHQAPEVPDPSSEPDKNIPSLPKNAVNVFPSNPFVSFPNKKSVDTVEEANQPIAKPRRRKDQNEPTNNNSLELNQMSSSGKMAAIENIKRGDKDGNIRDSTMSDVSTKSSHHYFVLEPDHQQMDYENSISSPKLV